MAGYILRVLGIVVAGVIIDVIIPSGSINKYIKSIYSIFVVAVLISPILNFVSNKSEFTFNYNNYEIDQELYEYITNQRVNSLQLDIKEELELNGFEGVDININFSLENNTLNYNSCTINLEKLVIDADKQHINKYEFIKEVVKDYTDLTDEEIIFNEWQRKESWF